MEFSIIDLHNKLKTKKISSLEIVQEALQVAKKNTHNAFISITEELALTTAKSVDQEISKEGLRSYIHGVPYTLKDLFVTADIRTTAGSKILYNYIPPYDGHISKSLKKYGGVLIGKVGCDEFGMGSTNENTPYGPVLNPVNPQYVAGGSSGGSAASVKEGSSSFSIGTDTGGSVRLPANFCGLVGLKPTYGRVSRYGQIAYASSLDQASPMAKTTMDIACIMEAITDYDPKDSAHAPLSPMKIVEELLRLPPHFLKGKKIGFAPELISGCKPEVRVLLEKALKLFKENGAELIEVNLDNIKYSVSTYYIIATAEASSNLSRYDGIHYGHRVSAQGNLEDTYVKSRSDGFGEEVKKRILLGTFALSSGYYDAYFAKACKVRRKIADDFQEAFKKCDVIFSPVCATSAMKLGEGVADPLQLYMNDLYTIPASLSGLPSLSLPAGLTSEGMPSGFQIIGQRFQDENVLKFGQAFEQLSLN